MGLATLLVVGPILIRLIAYAFVFVLATVAERSGRDLEVEFGMLFTLKRVKLMRQEPQS